MLCIYKTANLLAQHLPFYKIVISVRLQSLWITGVPYCCKEALGQEQNITVPVGEYFKQHVF